MKLLRTAKASQYIFILFVLTSCATTVNTSQKIDSQVQAAAVVKAASAQLSQDVKAPADTPKRLEEAVMKLASAHTGTKPVKLSLTITLWDVRDQGARALGGALVGSNKMDVAVEVLDDTTGAVIGRYSVQRRSNPGGYGMFYDQSRATIDEAAKGVIEGLYEKK